jgi:hypothetical protein
MPWPFGPDEEVTEEVKPKRKTKKDKLAEQEELVALLKFTPRTYRVMLSGYGGEIVLGSVPREQYQYFRDNEIDIEEYAWDCDNEQEVPEEMQPFTPGEWHSCDDVAHESGCELSEYNYITVTDENGKDHWQCKLGYSELTDAGVEVDETEESLCSDRSDRENTVGFIGQSVEKGCFFEGELNLTAPFDPSKLAINYSDIEGWSIITGVTYDGEDIEGYDGYDTRGKSSEFKFYDTGEDNA